MCEVETLGRKPTKKEVMKYSYHVNEHLRAKLVDDGRGRISGTDLGRLVGKIVSIRKDYERSPLTSHVWSLDTRRFSRVQK
jgi:hypothetical protein